ncbi:Pectinesterase inhibitor 12 [Cardamine amara subsp. amara]|uniref:Pectinesterase inhibitor 12 n=1 Tax=Cardamine amara subsp. amara TaxID=228776 RepID=A0ABD1B4P1_CARAN
MKAFLFYLVMFFLLFKRFGNCIISDSRFIYNFCVKSFEENPHSKTAKSLEELVLASTKNAAMKTTSLKEMVDKILKENKTDVERPLHRLPRSLDRCY